ncbi:MAG TPA: hypothetical protein VMI72_03900, partial [Roseiarcus sp.]|nr:hypothetical protein [Roseiarcus sp.]
LLRRKRREKMRKSAKKCGKVAPESSLLNALRRKPGKNSVRDESPATVERLGLSSDWIFVALSCTGLTARYF